MDLTSIEDMSQCLGIGRLCHMTPTRNLLHLVNGKEGILSVTRLSQDEQSLFTSQDLARYEGKPTHISCSIEYPNLFYFRNKVAQEPLFRDWVVLLIEPNYLWRPETLFCPHNASVGNGVYLRSGVEGFRSLYNSTVATPGIRTMSRGFNHIPSCPTDIQAETMVFDRISMTDIRGIVLPTEHQVRDHLVRFEYAQIDCSYLKFYFCPEMFDVEILPSLIRSGRKPVERFFEQ